MYHQNATGNLQMHFATGVCQKGPVHCTNRRAQPLGFDSSDRTRPHASPCLREIPDRFERAVRRKVDFGGVCERWFDEVYGDPWERSLAVLPGHIGSTANRHQNR
jgi:hypothetical protein